MSTSLGSVHRHLLKMAKKHGGIYPSIQRLIDDLMELAPTDLDYCEDGPTTGGAKLFDPSSDGVGDWDGREEEVADDYNSILDDVCDASLDTYLVGNEFHTHYETTTEWDTYYESASPIVEEWIARFWDDFCENYEIEEDCEGEPK